MDDPASTHLLDTAPAEGEALPDGCPVRATLDLLTGRWRLTVLFHLARGPVRWGGLRRAVGAITPRVLTATLRGLEADGLVWRRSEDAVPPVVTYGLTARGAALGPVFAAMGAWGERHLPGAAPGGTAGRGAPSSGRSTR